VDISLENTLYASCRVRSKKALGSATIISSFDHGDGFETYALTNHHVVEDCIKISKEYDPVVGREVPKEFKAQVEVDFPRFNGDRVVGFSTVLADIVTYDKHQDIALLKFRDAAEYPHANIIPEDKIKEIRFLQNIVVIGNPMGEKLVGTDGRICGMDIEIDNYDYWLGSAMTYFGNSGGGVFTQIGNGAWVYIGIPSRIRVAVLGWSVDIVQHLGYFIPPNRIWKWLHDTCYEYTAAPYKYTKEECDARRQKKVEQEIEKLRQSV
jgi:S1-C subfamily serine protease